MLKPGTILAGYRIEGILGRGGMGVVYEATQLSLGRTVAVKVIAGELSHDDRFRERFRREGLAQAAIDHPNIVTVFEAGEDELGLFIAMRLVRGQSLKALVRRGGLDDLRSLNALTQIADALDTAHQAGLIHRDVKSQNILVGERDQAYLADFGLTKNLGGSSRTLTRTDAVLGTLDYISPEQIRGEPVTARSDEYALAAVLHEALTGLVPFPKPSEAAVLFAHLSDPRPRITDQRPDLPTDIDDVIAVGMAVNPAERYTSCTALIQDATRAILGTSMPGSSTRVPIPGRGESLGDDAQRPGDGAGDRGELPTSISPAPGPDDVAPDGAEPDGAGPDGAGPDGSADADGSEDGDGGAGTPSTDSETAARRPPALPPLPKLTRVERRAIAPSEVVPTPASDEEPVVTLRRGNSSASISRPDLSAADVDPFAATRAPTRTPPDGLRTAPGPSSADLPAAPGPKRAAPRRRPSARLVATVAGMAVAGAGLGLLASSLSDEPALDETRTAGRLAISVPSAWRPTPDRAPVPGLPADGLLVLQDDANVPGMLAAAMVPETTPTLIPVGMDGVLTGDRPEPEPIRLGTHQALRHRGLQISGSSRRVTVYAVPAAVPGGTAAATVTCLIPVPDAAGFERSCERAAQSLALRDGAKALPVGPDRAFGERLSAQLAALDAERVGETAAESGRGDRDAALLDAAAMAYTEAAAPGGPLATLRRGPREQQGMAGITRAVQRIGAAYTDAAKALREQDRPAYDKLVAAMPQAFDELDRALAVLNEAGYEIVATGG